MFLYLMVAPLFVNVLAALCTGAWSEAATTLALIISILVVHLQNKVITRQQHELLLERQCRRVWSRSGRYVYDECRDN